MRLGDLLELPRLNVFLQHLHLAARLPWKGATHENRDDLHKAREDKLRVGYIASCRLLFQPYSSRRDAS